MNSAGSAFLAPSSRGEVKKGKPLRDEEGRQVKGNVGIENKNKNFLGI